MAQPRPGLTALDLPGWKTALSWAAAGALCLIFVISGVWKLADPQGWALRVAQTKVPEALSLPAAILVGIGETVGAVLILVPRFRRWGALLTGFLLVVFMAYFAINYNALRGDDCSCIPWLKRVVGPQFFIGDGIMLLGSVVAWVWSKPSTSLRSAFLVLGAVTVFALVSFGVGEARQTGTKAPATIMVDGKPTAIGHGRVYLYFFDPECMHCFDEARKMSHWKWGNTRLIVVPVQNPQFAAQFLQDTGLRAPVSGDAALLRPLFPFADAPAAVALENGRQKVLFHKFEGAEPAATLQRLGFIH